MNDTPSLARCKEVQDQLAAYGAGGLRPWQRHRVLRHLRECDNCTAAWARMEGLSPSCPEDSTPLSCDHKRRLLEGIQYRIGSHSPTRKGRHRWMRWVGVGVVAALAAAASWQLLWPQKHRPRAQRSAPQAELLGRLSVNTKARPPSDANDRS